MPRILFAREYDRDRLRRDRKGGAIEQLRRGAYRTVEEPSARSDRFTRERDRVLALIYAVSGTLRAPHWISHESAALLWGCQLWASPPRTHVTQAYSASSASADDIARHRLPLAGEETATIDGIPVTGLERTAVDCATTMRPLDALVILDQLLRLGMSRDTALAMIAARQNRRGKAVGKLLVELADAGAESPRETWLRYILVRAGLPAPQTQVPVPTRQGGYRADLGWPEWNLLVEYDGFVKYRQGKLRPDHDADHLRFQEKLRDDALRERGYVPVRVTSRDGAKSALDKVLRRVPEAVRATIRPIPLLPPI